MVNLLEPQDDIEIASYIGFDNAQAAAVSAYSVLDYFGGPGVLGAGEKVDVKPDDYLDLKWWEETYADADKDAIEAKGAIIEGIAGTFFSQARARRLQRRDRAVPGRGDHRQADRRRLEPREGRAAATEDFLVALHAARRCSSSGRPRTRWGSAPSHASERKDVLATRGRHEGARGRQGGDLHQRRDAGVDRRHPRRQADRRDPPRLPRVGLVRHAVRRAARVRPGRPGARTTSGRAPSTRATPTSSTRTRSSRRSTGTKIKQDCEE